MVSSLELATSESSRIFCRDCLALETVQSQQKPEKRVFQKTPVVNGHNLNLGTCRPQRFRTPDPGRPSALVCYELLRLLNARNLKRVVENWNGSRTRQWRRSSNVLLHNEDYTSPRGVAKRQREGTGRKTEREGVLPF